MILNSTPAGMTSSNISPGGQSFVNIANYKSHKSLTPLQTVAKLVLTVILVKSLLNSREASG
jgi:hypothetical protein